MNQLWKHLIPFGGKTDRFAIQVDCIFMGQRVYIPRTLRAKVLHTRNCEDDSLGSELCKVADLCY